MRDNGKSIEPKEAKKHEWGWAALLISIVVVNLGAQVWLEYRNCSSGFSKLKLCQAQDTREARRIP